MWQNILEIYRMLNVLKNEIGKTNMLVLPRTLSLITSHQCTAACEHCCFTCTPKVTKRIPYHRLESLIDEATEIPSIQVVVFTGGECFLLRDKLDALVARATHYGFVTRCITNGYWATSKKIAEMRVQKIVKAGLKEINFSTGTFHSKYVPISYIINGAYASAKAGLSPIINAEIFEGSDFPIDEIMDHPDLVDFISQRRIRVQRNVWIDNGGATKLSHTPENSRFNEHRKSGCNTVLNVISVTPDQHLVACCGLHLEKIPDLHMGSIANITLKNLLQQTPGDFLKIWMHVDGPERILEFVKEHSPEYKLPIYAVHPCETCLHLYKDEHAKKVIKEHYHEVEERVLSSYMVKLGMDLVERNASSSYEKLVKSADE